MPLINRITIKNFKSFREKVSFDFGEGSYFIGINNSGKSTILKAIQVFFDNNIIENGDTENLINRTSFQSKKQGSNTAEVLLNFNLKELKTKKFKTDLIKQYGPGLTISKNITVTTETKVVTYNYKINGLTYKELPDNIVKLLGSVKVTYLHPQEGQKLLLKAQEKLRQRLLANWGRGSNITQSIKKLQDEWNELRNKSRIYLSGSLTESLQKMWPGSEVSINLPKNIRDVITVSDINMSGYEGAPEIELTSQGTGAQSTILYLTHFLLDSDRTLHRGEYHPLWLLEEPESFLHVDLLSNLAKQLNSEKWLNNIQMVISTHSPVLLAASRVVEEKVVWNVLCERNTSYNKSAIKYSDDEVKDIGKIMGDPNFFAYFLAAKDQPLIFIEDEKEITVDKYKECGFKNIKALNGISEVCKFISVFKSAPFVVSNEIYFIVDNDKGLKELDRFYDHSIPDKQSDGFSRFKVRDSQYLYIVLLPIDFSAEDLFAEFENHLEECVSKLFDTATWSVREFLPTNLASLEKSLRRCKVRSLRGAINLIKNNDDVKYLFWEKVRRFNYKMNERHKEALSQLLSVSEDN